MKRSLIRAFRAFVASRAILLSLVAAFFAVTLISVTGMSTSVVVAETVQGSGSAINVAGSLRRLTHRVSALVVAEALDGSIGSTEIDDAMWQFESSLVHPSLRSVIGREHSSVAAAIYRGVGANWYEHLKPRLVGLTERAVGEELLPQEYEEVLGEVDTFVEQINTLALVLEHDAEAKIQQLRTILAVALGLTGAVVLAAMYLLRRRVFLPLAALGDAAPASVAPAMLDFLGDRLKAHLRGEGVRHDLVSAVFGTGLFRLFNKVRRLNAGTFNVPV